MTSEDNCILRKIYFFKIEHFEEVRESLPGALERIERLPFNDEGNYRLDTASGLRLCALPDQLKYPLKLRFGKTRRNALPQIERRGNLQTLELQEDEGLIDICHIMVFEDGFVASEWNHEGPKLAQLGTYIFEKGKLNTAPRFSILMQRDIVEVVKNLTSVRFFEIELPPDAAELARVADEGLYSAIKATASLGATKKVALKLTTEKNSLKLRDLARKCAELIQKRPHERDRFTGLNISGYEAGSRTRRYIDILENKLVVSEQFTRTSERSRSIDTKDAYKVIERAYLENKETIKIAATSADW